MGHANTQMLFTVYSRFVPNLTRQDGRAITGLLNSRRTTDAPVAAAPTPESLQTMTPDELRDALAKLLANQPHAA